MDLPQQRIEPVQQVSYEVSTPGSFRSFVPNQNLNGDDDVQTIYPVYLMVSSTFDNMKLLLEQEEIKDLSYEGDDQFSLKLLSCSISKEDYDSKTLPDVTRMTASDHMAWFQTNSSSGFKFFWSFGTPQVGSCSLSFGKKAERLEIPFQEAINLLKSIPK